MALGSGSVAVVVGGCRVGGHGRGVSVAEEAVLLWLLLLDDGSGLLPAAEEAMFPGWLLNDGSGLRLVTREERHV